MSKAVIVRGRFADPTHIELDEAVRDLTGPVEVTLKPLVSARRIPTRANVFGLCADLGSAPDAADIDAARAQMFSRFAHAD